MAFSATFSISSSSSFTLSRKIYRPFLSQNVHSLKPTSLKASSSTSGDYSTASVVEKQSTPSKVRSFCLQTGNWQWKFKENSINIYYEKHERESPDPSKNILMIPTISDVSTVEEWRLVAQDIVQRVGKVNWRATIVDWPGLGYSDRPKMDYNADVMEKFVVDLINAPDSPPCFSMTHVLTSVFFWTLHEVPKHIFLITILMFMDESDLVIFGGGHAATLTVRAAKKNLVKPTAIAAVAPTWAGPLPIVFGRDSSMETRYGLLRGTLRAPGVGWMMYNMLVSNEKAIQSQYKSHVYSNPDNVTPGIVESRYALTKRKGARYVPAAFLTGLLDPVNSREEFLQLFADLEGKLPLLVVSTEGSPRRSKAEMEALKGAKGVTKFVEVPGALLPQEEYPAMVAQELYQFLQQTFEPSD
ncbi:alpha/beta-Hydrolases superfamily protein [Citrus sinensis]|uniref:Alpha/beta-Hydrolases superfamily protein n=1 Tax=Citrus sinensis TaxID=2711 RepID=A0ACB8LXU7_CITSI|nr:alpha/beta-Hydrolases superfamily protein [Citrus sinensis]